jgi:tetratricopeptide (TPR) repeat protein
MMLLALMAFAVGMIFARRGNANIAPNSQLDALKAAVEKPDPKPETWLKYAAALQSVKRYKEAAVAYDQVLKADPYQRDARLGCAFCRATLGQSNPADVEGYYKFMRETIEVDPKTAKAIFERPEAAVYLAQARFQILKQDAIAGSMD